MGDMREFGHDILAAAVAGLTTWTRTVAVVREHAALRAPIAGSGDVQSVPASASP
jgi:hypothetical protein